MRTQQNKSQICIHKGKRPEIFMIQRRGVVSGIWKGDWRLGKCEVIHFSTGPGQWAQPVLGRSIEQGVPKSLQSCPTLCDSMG